MFLYQCQYTFLKSVEKFHAVKLFISQESFIQLTRGPSQVSGFCMVWVFIVKNIQADYRFCCHKINPKKDGGGQFEKSPVVFPKMHLLERG